MAKKGDKLGLKALFAKFMEKSLLSVASVVADQSEHIIAWIRNISVLRRKIRQFVTTAIIALAGLVTIAIGVGNYLESVIPSLQNGVAHMLVGLILIIIALLYSKAGE